MENNNSVEFEVIQPKDIKFEVIFSPISDEDVADEESATPYIM